jgi:DNA-binding transcriptional LysR family regulator
MKIRQLRIFKTVCEEESITKAAEKLFMTQPAVSQAINDLERDLNVQLFDRNARKIILNETGKLFLIKSEKLLDLYDELVENTRFLQENATLKIGSSITIANFILPQSLLEFEISCKQTPVRVNVDNARNIENMVINNVIDIGLIEGIIYHEELMKIPISFFKLAVICAPDHPFAKGDSIKVETLVEEKLLLREVGSAIRDVFDSALLLHDIKISPIWTSVNSQALIQAVKKGLGISVLPRILVDKEIKNNEIVEVKVNDFELISVNHIVFDKSKHRTKSFEKFVEIVSDVASRDII